MPTKQDKINDIVMEKLDILTTEINKIAVALAELPEKMSDKFDDRYASKKTEKAVDRLGWLVISAVVVAGLTVILK